MHNCEQLKREAVRPLGFVSSESGLVMVVDPTALVPYLKEGVLEEWVARAMVSFNEGEYEMGLGEQGGNAVVFPGAIRGRHVLAKELLSTGAVTIDSNVRDAA